MSAKKKPASKKKTAGTIQKAVATIQSHGRARTVIYCHGIGNKPEERQLRSEWDMALFGSDQGERTRMAYWVDRNRYPIPEGTNARTLAIDSELGPVSPNICVGRIDLEQ